MNENAKQTLEEIKKIINSKYMKPQKFSDLAHE